MSAMEPALNTALTASMWFLCPWCASVASCTCIPATFPGWRTLCHELQAHCLPVPRQCILPESAPIPSHLRPYAQCRSPDNDYFAAILLHCGYRLQLFLQYAGLASHLNLNCHKLKDIKAFPWTLRRNNLNAVLTYDYLIIFFDIPDWSAKRPVVFIAMHLSIIVFSTGIHLFL